jgi:8-oxo-dGTP pyrophosphatase MutT (NUDIX family)
MTPEEYERRPEVKAAIAFVKSRPELMRGAGWASYANRLMDVLEVPPEERKYVGGWQMPLEYQYAHKRAVARWSKKDAFERIVLPAIKSGAVRLGTGRAEGDELSYDAEGRLRWGRRAAGILIRRMDTKMFLLVYRSAEVMDPNVLGIPGGRVEKGELLEEAARGEAEEELGPLPPMQFIDRDIYRSGEFSYTTFLAHMSGEDAAGWKPTLNWENDAWIWVDPEEPEFRALEPEAVHPNVRRVLEKWA